MTPLWVVAPFDDSRALPAAGQSLELVERVHRLRMFSAIVRGCEQPRAFAAPPLLAQPSPTCDGIETCRVCALV